MMVGGKRPVLRPITFVGERGVADASSDLTIDLTGLGHQSGDVAVAILQSINPDADVTFGGWTLIYDGRGSNGCVLWMTTLTGSETTISTASGTSLSESSMQVIVFRGVTTTGYTRATATVTSNSPPVGFAAGASPTKGNALYIGCGTVVSIGSDWTGITLPSWANGRVENTAGTNHTAALYEYKVASSAQTPENYGGTVSIGTGIAVTLTLQRL